jgi:iron-sulfur cluster repair protein YtfE (RIC family)
MPVQIGAQTHSFADPTGLLSDCHRRIEMFLGSLQAVAAVADRAPSEATCKALETALRYFREAAPKHTADEEESLFPRMRQMQTAGVQAALRRLEYLEDDHRRADALHAEVDRIGNEYLTHKVVSPADLATFRSALAELASLYQKHILLEDTLVFPLASRLLSADEKAAIGREMAARRLLRGSGS